MILENWIGIFCHYDFMNELVFEIRDAEEGGFNARALGKAIFTQAETWEELRKNVLEAIECYYDTPAEQPKLVTLNHMTY